MRNAYTEIGSQARQWQDKNFTMTKAHGALALCEEAGEVARYVLKEANGIRSLSRGNIEEEIGDVLLTTLSLADRYDLDPADCASRRDPLSENPSKVEAALMVCEAAGRVACEVVEDLGNNSTIDEEIARVLLAVDAVARHYDLDPMQCATKRLARLLTLDFKKDPEGGRTPVR